MQWILTIIIFLGSIEMAIPSSESMISMVNEIRNEGCYCNNTWMPPVESVRWNDKLYRSAFSHARDMDRYDFFDHVNRKGQDIGARIDKFGYKWKVVGENIGMGQRTFSEVLEDWMESPTHCKMLMNPKVNEMGIAKKGKYWVQHFGKQMAAGKIQGKRRKIR